MAPAAIWQFRYGKHWSRPCGKPAFNQSRRKQRTGQRRNRSGGNRRQGKYEPYHHKDHQPIGNRLLPVHVQYRYLRFCIPAHGDNDFLTGAFYHLRHVPACELPP